MHINILRYFKHTIVYLWIRYKFKCCYFFVLSIIEYFHNMFVIIYPNPAHEYLRVSGLEDAKPYMIEICDLQGKVVLKKELTEDKPIWISNLNKGLYLYRVSNASKAYMGRLLIK